ncbi:hypothetical protein ACFL9U_10635 [Thermodesulfobacteriota bacterium]
MTICLYIFHCLWLIILQAAVLPHFSSLSGFYDLLLTLIIYLGLSRSVRDSVPVIFFAGFVMDNLSGGPFGVYLTTYFWMFATIKWLIKYFQAHNRALWLLIVAIGVLVENLIFFVPRAILQAEDWVPIFSMNILMPQFFWAILTGPLFLLFFSHFDQAWETWGLDKLKTP